MTGSEDKLNAELSAAYAVIRNLTALVITLTAERNALKKIVDEVTLIVDEIEDGLYDHRL